MQVQGPAIVYRALREHLGVGWFSLADDVQFGKGDQIVKITEPANPVFDPDAIVAQQDLVSAHEVRLTRLMLGKTPIGVAVSASKEAMADFKEWFTK
jgi:hypothetical protein